MKKKILYYINQSTHQSKLLFSYLTESVGRNSEVPMKILDFFLFILSLLLKSQSVLARIFIPWVISIIVRTPLRFTFFFINGGKLLRM